MAEASKSHVLRNCLLLGLCASLLAGAGGLLGIDRRLELLALDWRFRTLSTAAGNDHIVNISIDDASISVLGRWPWPRSQTAAMVDVLRQCGARAVMLDIELPHPQGTRYVSEAAEVYGASSSQAVYSGRPLAVFDDVNMAATLEREANIVFLPVHFELDRPCSPLEKDIEDIVLREGDVSLAQAMAAWNSLRSPTPSQRVDEAPKIRRAYLRARSVKALGALALAPEVVNGCPAIPGAMRPPLPQFARALKHTGFVTVLPDVDGLIRRIPLIGTDGRSFYPQLALAVAAGDLGAPSPVQAADARHVTLGSPGQVVRRIPIDANGCMLVNWMRSDLGQWGVAEISATEVGLPYVFGQKIEANNRLRAQLMRRLMELSTLNFRTPELEELITGVGMKVLPDMDLLYESIVEKQAAYQWALLNDPRHLPPWPQEAMEQEQKLEAQAERAYQALHAELADARHLEFYLQPPGEANAPAPADEGMQQKLKEAKEILAMLEEIPQANETLRQETLKRLESLRPRVSGKICLVGSTATAAADFVPTVLDRRTPGVIVHANIINTILSGAFVHEASWAWNLLAVLAAGMLASCLAATQPVLRGGPMTVALAGALVAGNALLVFHVFNVWLAVVSPLAAMLLSFLVITAFRQLTEERAKRKIRGILAQTLSPALVDRVEEDPSLLKLGGEKRELTCFFSDLAGFTPLSKRLGEQETIRLLNRYFDRMTDVVWARRGGYLSKFMGDGIFVFFGAPVFQDDHPARAILAAVECQEAVAAFNRELATEVGGVKLTCRIGISTGPAMVGNCGSTDRIDYTAIGDTVNLASRLEGANKSFGTLILAEDETWVRAAAADIVARPMGRIFVVGRDEPVAVWNVLGRREGLDPAQQQAAEEFARAVELFAARDFTRAAAVFEPLSLAAPADKAAGVYLSLCRQYLASPPTDGWAGEIHLTEK